MSEREPAHVVNDLADKAAKDATGAVARVASLLDHHADRFIVTTMAAGAIFGACVAEFQMMAGVGHVRPTEEELEAVIGTILSEAKRAFREG